MAPTVIFIGLSSLDFRDLIIFVLPLLSTNDKRSLGL